jgi:cytokinin dehydrogenase
MSDYVLELEVVTGQGEQVICSPDRHPSLFDAVRAGLGQVGVITRATLRLVPAPRLVRRFLLFYPDLATMLATSGCWSTSPGSRACRGRCWHPNRWLDVPARPHNAVHRGPTGRRSAPRRPVR